MNDINIKDKIAAYHPFNRQEEEDKKLLLRAIDEVEDIF